LQHRGVIFLQQLSLHAEAALAKEFLQVQEHPFTNARDGENLLGFADEISDLLAQIFDGLRGIAVRADSERVRAIDFQQVGGVIEDRGDGFIVHG
jgi:hypothetical protein